MIGKSLVNAVHKEAAKLFKNATQEEKDRLDFEGLDPNMGRRCVYGQMTGYCYSSRATKLITACASLVLRVGENELPNVSCALRHENKKNLQKRNGDLGYYIFSPIEVYTAQDGADNAQLIAYLKGECDILDLSPTINC